jgi:hypothetical protein
MVEERLQVELSLARLAPAGVPDIRVIVYRGVPVMAMMRVPTRASGGRANLHQGAIGVGVDLVTGMTHHAVMRGTPVRENPDSGQGFSRGRSRPWRGCWRSPSPPDETGPATRADVVIDARAGR